MSKADICMNYDSVVNLAGEVRKIKEEFDKMVSELNSLANDLDGQWQGKAQVEFAVSYKKLKAKLEIISEVLGNYDDTFTAAVSDQKNTESVNVSKFEPITQYNGF